MQPLPLWCQMFRCTILKSSLDVRQVEIISGRSQAQASNVMVQSFSETVDKFWEELQLWRKDNPNREPNRTQLLLQTYERSGKNIKNDNTPVCSPFSVSALPCTPWL